MKPLIIGEAPSKNEITASPLEGRIGKRLAVYAGLPFPTFLTHFDRVNLLDVRQDTDEEGFTFDLPVARINAELLRLNFKPGQIVLLLGGRVAEAFKIHGPYFEKHTIDEAEVYIVPHMSGVNRWHNEAENKAEMTRFMREIVEWTLLHV